MPPLPPPSQPNPLLRWGALVFLLAGYACVGLVFGLAPYWEISEDYQGRFEWLDVVMLCLALGIPLFFLHALLFSLIAICKGQARELNKAVLVALLLSIVALLLL